MLTSRRRVAEVASEAVENISPYVDQFAHDEKFRRRLIAAIGAAAAARRRAKRQAGWLGLAAGLSSDPVLRAQVAQAVVQLQKAKNRKSRRKHTMRNATLIIGGSALVVAAVPELRVSVVDKLDRLKRRARGGPRAGTTATIVEDIEVGAPVSVVYNQWTQFEEFPSFMEHVEEVRQIDDTHLHWRARVAGKERQWDAHIHEQEPNKKIAWRATSGTRNDGVVRFEPVGPTSTRVEVEMAIEPDTFGERVGSAMGLPSRQVKADLERFRELIERRDGVPTGTWRGSV